MNEDAKSWKRFTRTVETATAAALAREDMRALDAGGQQAPAESFIALAASAEGVRERAELRNARKDLSLGLVRADGGVEVDVSASGFASIRDWRGARGLLAFAGSGITATLMFDDRGRATKFIAGVDLDTLARDAVTLARI